MHRKVHAGVTWRIHICDMTRSHVWHDSSTCVTWLIYMCDMTHSHVWHDSSYSRSASRMAERATMSCGMTHSHVWRDSFTCVTWLIHMCDVTHSDVWRDLFTCMAWLTTPRVTWFIHTCDMIYLHVWHDSSYPRSASRMAERATRWLSLSLSLSLPCSWSAPTDCLFVWMCADVCTFMRVFVYIYICVNAWACVYK